jgi:iron complex transport system ATP-binding protein
LLRTLAGLRPVESGDIFLDGKSLSVWPLAELARERAFLSQSRTDAFGYSAIETVLSARHPYHDAHYWESGDDMQIALDTMRTGRC